MTAQEAIALARARGVILSIGKDQVHFNAPNGALSPKLREALAANRDGILAELRRELSKPAFKLVTTAQELMQLAVAVEKAGVLALDIETTGLDPLSDRPRLLQLALPNGNVYIIDLWAVKDIGVLGKALRNVTAVNHTIQFDLAFLRHHYGIIVRQARCTMTAARLIDAGVHCGPKFKRYFSLAAVAYRSLGLKLDKTMQKADWSGTLTTEHLQYAADDVLYIFRLHDVLQQQLRDLQLTEAYELECDVIPVVVEMYLNGLPIEPERWQGYLAAQQTTMQKLENQLADELPGVNPRSPDKLLPALRKLGCEVNSTRADVLAHYTKIPTVDHLLRYRSVYKFICDLGPKVAHALALHGDNRVHTPLFSLGAPTGRMSCSNPNLLSMPKRPEARRCTVPAPGRKFISADYSAIELRVVADLTKDPLLLEIFRSGGDPHRTTAARLLHRPDAQITKEERQQAKVVNFGFIFGMGAETFVEYAYGRYQLKFSLAEAARFRRDYLKTYVGIAAWQRRTGRLRAPSIRTASGRLRRFEDPDDSYCASLNTPIQGTAADGMKKALILLHQELPRFGAKLLLAVHDEVLIEAPAEAAEEVKAVVVSCMKRGMEAFVKSVPIEVEASVRTTWSESDVETQ